MCAGAGEGGAWRPGWLVCGSEGSCSRLPWGWWLRPWQLWAQTELQGRRGQRGHVLPQPLGNVTFAGPGLVVEFEMGAEMPTHRGTRPSRLVTGTRTGGAAAEQDLCLLSTALCPGLRKICKRKLDSKLFCLAAGAKGRGGSLITSSLRAETQTPGSAVPETALRTRSSAQAALQLGTCTVLCPKARSKSGLFIIFSVTCKVSPIFVLQDQI